MVPNKAYKNTIKYIKVTPTMAYTSFGSFDTQEEYTVLLEANVATEHTNDIQYAKWATA